MSLAAANALVGNAAPATAVIEIGPFGAAFTAREGAVRIALAGKSAERRYRRARVLPSTAR